MRVANCPYCKNPARYGLKEAELCEFNFLYHKSPLEKRNTGDLFMGHKEISGTLSYPDYAIECEGQNEPDL